MSNRVRPTKSTSRARPAPPPDDAGRRSVGLVIGILVAAVAVGGILVAILALGDSDGDDTVAGEGSTDDESAVATTEPPADLAFGQVELAGDPLPPFEELPDPAIGRVAPAVRGFGPDGVERAFASGSPRAIMFVAHWCPHCQDEIDALRTYEAEGGSLPDGVEIQTIATWTDESRANFPPGEWLAANGWRHPTIIDDEEFTLAQGFGLTATPMWIFIDAEGIVVERTGALSPDDLVSRMASLGA